MTTHSVLIKSHKQSLIVKRVADSHTQSRPWLGDTDVTVMPQ